MPGEYASFAMRAVSLGRKRGRPPVLSANAFYPFAAERRLATLLKEELSRSIRESLAASLGRLSDDGEEDGWTEGFLSGTERAASEIVLNAREAFSRFSEMTVGTPYYPPDVEERVKDDWKAEFLACCRSADADAKADIARALTEAKEKGWNRAQAEAAVLERLDPKYAKRAELIARTETGKLNNAATMATYRSAGVEYYVWLATPDERTRHSHAALNGKICAVGDPDSWYEDNPDDPLRPVAHGRGKDMYHGDPGTDFQCRCTSIPWDPRIDSKYRVRKVPEPERKPTELETARAETEKARGELEAATAAKRETERKLEILRAANARHAARKTSERLEIQERWDRRERTRRIAEVAETRHAARTASDSEKIRKFRKWRAEMPKDLREKEKTAMAENWLEIEKALGIAKGDPMSVEKADMQSANPKYIPEFIPDPNGPYRLKSTGQRISRNPAYSGRNKQYHINCQTCVPAYALRLHGFDITAKGNTPGSMSEWISYGRSFEIWKNPDGTKPKPTLYSEFMLLKGYLSMTANRYLEFFEETTKEKGVYLVTIGWKGSGGHATVVQRLENGKLVRIEPQEYSGKTYENLSGLIDNATKSGKNLFGRGIMRIDNKMFDKRYLSIFET